MRPSRFVCLLWPALDPLRIHTAHRSLRRAPREATQRAARMDLTDLDAAPLIKSRASEGADGDDPSPRPSRFEVRRSSQCIIDSSPAGPKGWCAASVWLSSLGLADHLAVGPVFFCLPRPGRVSSPCHGTPQHRPLGTTSE